MRKGTKISGAEVEALLRDCRAESLLRENGQWSDRVPAHADRAADRAFAQMERWIAAGRLPPEKGAARPLPRPRAGLRAAAVALGASALLAAGSYAALPPVRDWVNGSLCAGAGSAEPARRQREPGDYVIPSPGENYVLRDETRGERAAAKWFSAAYRQLMVQIAWTLPEEPPASAFEETLSLGGVTASLYNVNGDRQLLFRDGELSILIKMYNADREELLAYAERFLAANDL